MKAVAELFIKGTLTVMAPGSNPTIISRAIAQELTQQAEALVQERAVYHQLAHCSDLWYYLTSDDTWPKTSTGRKRFGFSLRPALQDFRKKNLRVLRLHQPTVPGAMHPPKLRSLLAWINFYICGDLSIDWGVSKDQGHLTQT